MWLSECEKVELAADFAALLTQPCIIERRGVPTKDAFGGSSASFTQTSSVCRILALKSPREPMQAGQIASTATQQILLPLTTQISPKDRILTAGTRFEVTATDSGKTDALFLTIDAVKSFNTQ